MLFLENSNYIVDGLVNESIKTQIKNALDKIDGVNKVSVDIGLSSIAVAYNEPATSEVIRNCIEDTGHTIRS